MKIDMLTKINKWLNKHKPNILKTHYITVGDKNWIKCNKCGKELLKTVKTIHVCKNNNYVICEPDEFEG